MSNPARSLNTLVAWQRLLRELGTPSRQLSLPAQTSCPLCRVGVMTTYEDYVSGGQWYRCGTCRSSGDLIELASRVWNLTIPATVAKLRRLDFDLPIDQAAVSKYLEQHVDYRQRLQKLWQDSTGEMSNPSGPLQKLIASFNLHSQVPPERWREGPGSLLGGIDTESIERAFAPGVMQYAEEKSQRCSPSQNAIFRGPGWHDALVLPFCDLPGRICAFLFVGRDGEYPHDFVFRRANIGPRGNQYLPVVAEAGLAMHPQALQSSNEWGRLLVAIAEPMMGLALQTRHFEQSQQALPVVLFYDSLKRTEQHQRGPRVRTTNAWQMLGNRRVVFWMPEFCIATIEQAIAIDGLISTVGPRKPGRHDLQNYVWKCTPSDLIRHIAQTAKPWPEVISRSFEQMSETEIERHVERMQVDGIDVERALKKCATAAQRRVRCMLDRSVQRVARLVKGDTVVERAGKWYVRVGSLGHESLISDGILRIDKILNHRRQNKAFVGGRVIFEGKTVKFCEPLASLEQEGMRWMQNLLIQREVGYMIYDPKFRTQSVDLARVFNEPKLGTAITAVGWNEKNCQFVLPKFSLDSRGKVVHSENMILDKPTPAKNLSPPDLRLTPEELDRGAQMNEETKLFWAVLAAMIANLVAPTCQRQRAGIALCGTGAVAMGQAVASALGCISLDIETAKDVRHALDLEHVHGWPLLVVERHRLQRRFRRELFRCRPNSQRNMVLSVDWCESRMLALGGKWNVIEGGTVATIRPELTRYAASFVVAYLQDLCRRRFALGDWRELSDAHAENILRDIARFVREQEGDDAPILAANAMIRPAREDGHAAAFADLIAHWLRIGTLTIADYEGQFRGPILVRVAEGFLFNHDLLTDLAKDKAVDVPSIDQVTEVLDSAGVLVEERADCWVLNGDWLEQHVKSAAGPLSVVG